MSGRTYIFAAGGTGGHLFPGIAVAERLVEREPQARVLFVGSDRPIEREILSFTPFEHRVLPAVNLTAARRQPLRSVRDLMAAFRAARQLMQTVRPVAVVGCGGFASVAPVLAAWKSRVPFLLLEQNVIPGRSTRWLSRLGGTVCLTFAETAAHLPGTAKTVVTGNPVRRKIAELASSREPRATRTLLVLGGSQGARRINDMMLELVTSHRSVLDGRRVIHQTGPADEQRVRTAYAENGIDATVSAFFSDAADLYLQADIVVSRAGGTTLAELASAGLPAILLPFPQAADNHQWYNARAFQDAGAAILFEDSADASTCAVRLAEILAPLFNDAERWARMSTAMTALARPAAATDVVMMLDQLQQPA